MRVEELMAVKFSDIQVVEEIINNEKHKITVHILMTLTSPGCPLASVFDELVGGAVRKLPGVSKVDIEITFDPPWTMEKMSEAARAELGYF